MGRPSKYEERFCDEVVAHCVGGASLTSFAALIGVSRSRINEWMAAHEEFRDACARAKANSAAWWESQARKLVADGGNSAQGSMIQFGMKNMGADDWAEKTLVGSDPDNPLPEGFKVAFVKADKPDA